MRPSLRSRDSVYLVDDHRASAAEHPTTFERRQHDVERLGSRDKNVRSFPEHSGPSRGRRIASPHCDPYFRELLPRGGEPASKVR